MRVRVRYTGRVQGVGFRASVCQAADQLPITGWVRNEPDGSVLMEAQGDEASLGQLRERVRAARVGHIRGEDASTVAQVAGETAFEVRY